MGLGSERGLRDQSCSAHEHRGALPRTQVALCVCPKSCTAPLAWTPFPTSLSALCTPLLSFSSCILLPPSLCPPPIPLLFLFWAYLFCTNASGAGCSCTAVVAEGVGAEGPPEYTPYHGGLAFQRLHGMYQAWKRPTEGLPWEVPGPVGGWPGYAAWDP